VAVVVSLLAAYVFLHRKRQLEDIETPEDKARHAAAAA
jgi:hypothetical protein